MEEIEIGIVAGRVRKTWNNETQRRKRIAEERKENRKRRSTYIEVNDFDLSADWDTFDITTTLPQKEEDPADKPYLPDIKRTIGKETKCRAGRRPPTRRCAALRCCRCGRFVAKADERHNSKSLKQSERSTVTTARSVNLCYLMPRAAASTSRWRPLVLLGGKL